MITTSQTRTGWTWIVRLKSPSVHMRWLLISPVKPQTRRSSIGLWGYTCSPKGCIWVFCYNHWPCWVWEAFSLQVSSPRNGTGKSFTNDFNASFCSTRLVIIVKLLCLKNLPIFIDVLSADANSFLLIVFFQTGFVYLHLHIPSCSNVHMSSCPYVIMSICHHVHMSSCPHIHMSSCPHIHVFKCPHVIMS